MILEYLKRSANVLLASHKNPDGDAVGSCLALALALKSLGKSVTIYNESRLPAVYRYLPEVEIMTQDPGCLEDYDTVVVLDCGDLSRIGELHRKIEGVHILLNIDHHQTNTRFGKARMIKPEACSTSEIIHDLITELGVEITKEMAFAIYTGIVTDTGSFRFSNTTGKAFEICADMVDKGANPYIVAQHIYSPYSLGRIKLLNMVLESIELSKNGKLSLMSLTQRMLKETGTSAEDVNGLVNYAKHIEDVKVAAFIQEAENQALEKLKADETLYYVSLRSDGTVDVSSFAATFGGGGHSTAAGFTTLSTYTALKENIMRLADAL